MILEVLLFHIHCFRYSCLECIRSTGTYCNNRTAFLVVLCKFFHTLIGLRLKSVSLQYSWFSMSYAGVYGNVLRVKILFNKKDSALVEYSDPQHAFNGSVTTWHIFYLS